MVFIFSVLGVVLILEGIPYFAFPRKVKGWAVLLQEIPDRSLRIMGLISMAAGLLLIYMMRFL
jgi:uncharacterized protein YjeT (DUF2065 family)